MRPPTLTSMQRGTYRDDHGTPDWILDMHREIHGPIDVDMASNADANAYVQAVRYYTETDPCPDVISGNSIWCNPPGPSGHVQYFWDIWRRAIERGSHGSFLCFSVDHFAMLERPGVPVGVLFLRSRVRFRGQTSSSAIGSCLIGSRPCDGWLRW
jgi:hypothetical protein